ncbi:DUF6766 family protein [Niveispirillum cyanobacteriorum]|uniref:Uncharacterized protein n=1 Tax=Niveispirillum cyanobacteriorum TaxID=1612173 RepID=A0A2K9NE36_9PROT|nr:DUF6766 family protein [Niveispirillum cyanobacteriorum]AUN31411.1 hypothetical protein C0V82_15090 [Niveispirillum cyanobacteriorum]GGE71339.1 hypothetical protein GCM10011317_30820 [Niveispirillum cyanobacteriorum]
MQRYAYGWITLAFFAISMLGHWIFGWFAYADAAIQHGNAPTLVPFIMQMGRETFENWQSEFLQLLWQVCGLAYFLYAGSPASKENDDRMEAKIDALLRLQAGDRAGSLITALDERYLRTHGHAKPLRHGDQPVGITVADPGA